MSSRLVGSLRRFHPDRFVLSLVGVVMAATLLPCRGVTAEVLHGLGILAISSLFFLQGARLSRDAVVGGITHWRLHATIGATTFVMFPLVGLGMITLFPNLLPQPLWIGVIFACALPSTVQSSIALTSIAQGNVAGAVCSATASNLAGIVLTPFIFGTTSRLQGGTHAVANVGQILLELLVPFVIGHLFRPRIGDWAERSRKILSITDRGSILLVVYTAFSGAVVNGVWHDLPPATLVLVGLVMFLLLAIVLAIIVTVSRALDFGKPDEIAAVFCGSQKSLVSGVPIANVLFSGTGLGMALIPIMLYYPAQLVVCAWLARRYAGEPAAITILPALPNSHDVVIGLVELDGAGPSGHADEALV